LMATYEMPFACISGVGVNISRGMVISESTCSAISSIAGSALCLNGCL
jgi:hypothetical protein